MMPCRNRALQLKSFLCLILPTWSEDDPEEEFLDLAVIEARLESLWVDMFLVLGRKLMATLEALEESRDLSGAL